MIMVDLSNWSMGVKTNTQFPAGHHIVSYTIIIFHNYQSWGGDLWYFVAIKDDGEFPKRLSFITFPMISHDFPWDFPWFPHENLQKPMIFQPRWMTALLPPQVEQHPMREFKAREVANMSWSVATVQVGQLGHGMVRWVWPGFFGLKKGWKKPYGCGSKWKAWKKKHTCKSSLVLTIQLLGYLILTHSHMIKLNNMGLSENRLNPIVPNGFADHYPYEKWLFHWGYTPIFRHTHIWIKFGMVLKLHF